MKKLLLIISLSLGVGFLGVVGNNAAAGEDTQSKVASITFPVEGMTCGSCEWSVEKTLKKLSGNMLYLANFGVAPESRGKRIGTQILERQIQFSTAEGCSVLALDVAVNNPRAQSLYERLGFRVAGYSRFNFFGGVGVVPDARRMVRQV